MIVNRESFTTPEHIDQFERWQAETTENYLKGISPDKTVTAQLKALLTPLYRRCSERPNEVFQKNGALYPSNAKWREGSFSLKQHQKSSKESAYTSCSRSLPASCDIPGGGSVYVIDPQPHGRNQNSHNADQNDIERLVPYYLAEQEVSVPGSIPTEDIRGAMPYVPGSEHGVAYDGLIKNPYYVPQTARRSEESKPEADAQAVSASGADSRAVSNKSENWLRVS